MQCKMQLRIKSIIKFVMRHLICAVSVFIFVVVWFFLLHQLQGIMSRVDNHLQSTMRVISSEPNCVPKSNVFFLKTHKCASSTVQNILMRFGERRRLNFVLPPDGNYLGHPEPFAKEMAMPLTNGSFNVFCHHTRFNEEQVEFIMPGNTVYVTILREPVSLFESLFVYFDMRKHWNVDLEDATNVSSLQSRAYDRFGRNQMSFDLGLNPTDFDSVTTIRRFIGQIKKRFDLVMLAERFDESLVLLKQLLCWQMEDVIYFRQNTRVESVRRVMNESIRQKLTKWNKADKMLYDYFDEEFEGRVRQFGAERMRGEVAELRRWNGRWYNHCIERQVSSTDQLQPEFRAWSQKVFAFHLRPGLQSYLCDAMAKTEIAFTQLLRKQHKREHYSLIQFLFSYILFQ